MTFNPDCNQEAQGDTSSFVFNNNNASQVNFQTHLGVILDVKLTFEEHLKKVFN